MGTFRYGLKSLIISELSSDGITPVNPLDCTNYVFNKTFEITESEASKTELKAENNIYSSIILKEAAPETAKVVLFNFPLALKASLKGGTSADLDNKTTLQRATENQIIERQITMVTKDNVEIKYVRCFVDAVKDHKANDADVEKLNLTMIPMLPSDGSAPIVEKEL